MLSIGIYTVYYIKEIDEMVLDGTLHKTYERGFVTFHEVKKVRYNGIYFGQLVHSQEYRSFTLTTFRLFYLAIIKAD